MILDIKNRFINVIRLLLMNKLKWQVKFYDIHEIRRFPCKKRAKSVLITHATKNVLLFTKKKIFFLNFKLILSLKTVENGRKKVIGINKRNGNDITLSRFPRSNIMNLTETSSQKRMIRKTLSKRTVV